jgi:ankyrin repeat protein
LLNGFDFRLFQNTQVWELAKAVQDQDTTLIKSLAMKYPNQIDYQESKFGESLLMLSVLNNLYNSTNTLLKLGANANLHDRYKGSTPVIEAAKYNNNADIMKLLLKYGGDSNSTDNAPTKNDSSYSDIRNFALLEASMNNIDLVKTLIKNGANVNQTAKPNGDGALENSLIQEKYDISLFLLQNGADYKKKVKLFTCTVDMLYLLKNVDLGIDTKKYIEKMKVVEFLQAKGLDYWNYPIPDKIVEDAKKNYPEQWKEHLHKY